MVSFDDTVFTWSESKNRENIKKHGIAFQEAVPVFLDAHLVVVYDEAHSSQEEARWKCIGLLDNRLLISVIFTEPEQNIIKLISARKASLTEKEHYRENINRIFGY